MRKLLLVSSFVVATYAAPTLAQDNVGTAMDNYIGFLRATGGQVNFDERIESGNSVEYRGIEITDPIGDFSLTTDWFKATATGSPGQVMFSIAPEVMIAIVDGDVAVPVKISTENLSVVADAILEGAENAANHNYVIYAPIFKVVAGAPDHEFVRNVAVDLRDFSFSLNRSLGEESFVGALSSSQMSIGLDFTDPNGNTTQGKSMGGATSISFGFDMVNEETAPQYLSGDKNAFLQMSFGPSRGSTRMTIEGAEIDYSGVSEGGEFSVTMMDGLFRFFFDLGAAEYQINSVGMIPIPPFAITADRFMNEIVVPTKNTGDFAPAVIKYQLANLTIGEGLLSLFDSGQAIPREPINLDVDVNASVKINADWSDPESVFDGNPMDVAEVDRVNIDTVLLAAGGAEISAEGQVTLDNSGPFPMPSGGATVIARGVQRLTNALVQIGLVEQMQAGMVMGVIMSFGRPGDGADEFISDLEFSPQGITANGVPIPF